MTPEPQLLHAFFLEAARRHPSAVAVEVPPSTTRPSRLQTTYAELEESSRNLAGALAPYVGSADEAIVALLLPREDGTLYQGQLGVLRAGAAHVSIDGRVPDARLLLILEDSDARVVVTNRSGAKRLSDAGFEGPVMQIEALETTDRDLDAPQVSPFDLAYLIYTSGTTGRPKAVQIEHHSAANLVGSDVERFGLGPADRVAQSSSVAFDSSVEEIWLAWAVGATVVVLDDETARLGPDLVPLLREERITVLCPTPTLLRATGCRHPQKELPELGLIYIGGEAVPSDLVDRWAPGRRFENGYGPTECTVTVVRTELRPGHPVTIGYPVRGHTAYVLDEDLQDVVDGEIGELCIAGPGLARGYRKRPEKTAESFPVHERFGRIYRTGDLARRLPDGALECLGRVDGQVKIRGHRIELEEIEARLLASPSVRDAACAVQQTTHGKQLVAYAVPVAQAIAEPRALRQELAAELPEYMVPAAIGLLDELPRSLSGKLDRKRLPELDFAPATLEGEAATDELEEFVARCGAEVLGVEAIPVDRDFFDLGGDSVRAAEWISILRDDTRTRSLGVRDVYELRSVRPLAERARSAAPPPTTGESERVTSTDRQRARIWFGVGVTLVLACGLLTGSAIAWLGIEYVLPWVLDRLGVYVTLLLVPLLLRTTGLITIPLGLAFAKLAQKILMPVTRPGRYPVWSFWHFRLWLLRSTLRLIPIGLTSGTVMQSWCLRFLGAKVGRRVHLHRGVEVFGGGFDLLEIGDDATLSQDCRVSPIELVGHEFLVAPVRVGERAVVETRAAMAPGTSLGDDSILKPLSSLREGSNTPPAEVWDGVPAKRVAAAPSTEPSESRRADLSGLGHGIRQIVLEDLVANLLALPALALLIVFLVAAGLEQPEALLGFLLDPHQSPRAVVGLLLLIALGEPLRLLTTGLAMRFVGRVPAGRHDRFSPTFSRIWIRTGILERAGNRLSGSLYWPWWLRLAGMRIGKRSELSTITDVLPEQITVGASSFFADGIYLGGSSIRAGQVTVAPVEVGSESFLGNHVVVPAGVDVPDQVLLGVCTVADPASLRTDSSWFGHPPFELPRREIVEADRRMTHDPTRAVWLRRFAYESARFVLPSILALLGLLWIDLAESLRALGSETSYWLALLPLTSLAAAAAALGLVLGAKWALIGRVRPGQHALWSHWCCRWDSVYVLWDAVGRGALAALDGTPLLPPVLRLFGVRIGRGVVLGQGFAQVVDPDMLHFEAGSTVAGMFQAHTFEDRVLKIAHVSIRERATTRAGSVLMYGADIGRASRVEPNTVVMKNERLEPSLAHEGVPSSPGQHLGPS